MNRPRRLLIALLTLVAPLVLLIAPAGAEVINGKDPRGDVRYAEDRGAEHEATRAERRQVDLTGYRFTHGKDRFTAVLRYRQLDRSDLALLSEVSITYPSRGERRAQRVELTLMASAGDPGGVAFLQDNDSCPVRHRIRYGTNRITMSFPTRCLDTPRWVRANAGAVSTDYVDNPSFFYLDTLPGFENGRPGPKLKRG